MDSALSKVERAERLVQELRGVLEKKRPFKYFVETNIRTKERRTGARRDATVIGEVLTIVGDIVHNLRSALDHAYWEIVGPLATSPNEEKKVQFPFGSNPIQFENEIKTRMGERVSQRFVDELRRIAPHGGPNGNSILYSIHELNNMDKHKFPVPVGDFKSSSGIEMRRQIPDFPFLGLFAVSNVQYDIAWTCSRTVRAKEGERSELNPEVFEKEIFIPIEITFEHGSAQLPREIVPAIDRMIAEVKKTVACLRSVA